MGNKVQIKLILIGLSILVSKNIKEGIIMDKYSKLKLPKLISDGMVLQRDSEVKVWGWASPEEAITVDFAGKFYITAADNYGNWKVVLKDLKAGGPYNMEIKSSKEQITIKNVLVGDVWVCSGQSNMVTTMERVSIIYEDEIANCENSFIRQFIVPDRYDFNNPKEDLEDGTWKEAGKDTILSFTAVGYFFAKYLFKKYHVPIGLIKACVGGTPITAWFSEDAIKKFPENLEVLEKLKDEKYVNNIKKEEAEAVNTWFKELNEKDEGLKNDKEAWFDPSYEPIGWKTMKVPSRWEDEGLKPLNGSVWFRKEVFVPDSMTEKSAKLYMGTIIDSDFAYINGVLAGSTGYQYPPRRYEIPEGIIKEGKNIITIRVISNNGNGQFIKEKPYKLFTKDQSINLEGEWQYKVGAKLDRPMPSTTFFEYKPVGLFNGMISPLLNYAIKGVIWYQGESDTHNPIGYKGLFSAMVSDWREKWKQGEFPFLYVQLANFMEAKAEPSESEWAELRQQQLKCLEVPNTGMAAAIDIGEWNDLHPLNKKDVGERLALLAQNIAYGDKDIVSSGPIYKSLKIEGNKAVISFSNLGGGLISKDGDDLKHFAVAGSDKKFLWAKAIIDEDKVVVWNDKVMNPSAVRYAWADNPEGANLYNKEGLPASPFTTES